jgi:hypothetical protein
MGKNQDPGSGINIPDPQHWLWICDLLFFESSFMSLEVFFECSFSILEDKKLIKSNITVKNMIFRSVGDPGSGTFLTTGFGIRMSFFGMVNI